jgi:hypothetical protein
MSLPHLPITMPNSFSSSARFTPRAGDAGGAAYFGSLPPSLDAFLAVVTNPTSKENSYIRQVCSYWEMVASLVAHGTLNSRLVYGTCQEIYFVCAKIQPYLAALREKTGTPDFLAILQKVVEGLVEGRERIARLQARIAAVANARAEAAG